MFNRLSFTQSRKISPQLIIILLVVLLIGLTGCGSTAPEDFVIAEDVVAVYEAVEVEAVAKYEPAAEEPAFSSADAPADEASFPDVTSNTLPLSSNRLIIKNAEVAIQVSETDVAIDRATGIAVEYGGYIVSSRSWQQNDYKYATLAMGVPVDNFEDMLRRLKDLAVDITNETISGQDVTDEYVDLESRLTNLEATATRIRDFLKDADDVDAALRVSNQLSQVEGEIEHVKGRMNYLKDRAAYSTITLQIAPEIEIVEPEPVTWSALEVVKSATVSALATAQSLFQGTVSLVIWVAIVILPYVLIIVAILWIVRRTIRGLRPVNVSRVE